MQGEGERKVSVDQRGGEGGGVPQQVPCVAVVDLGIHERERCAQGDARERSPGFSATGSVTPREVVSHGVGQVYAPAGEIVAGLFVLALGWLLAKAA